MPNRKEVAVKRKVKSLVGWMSEEDRDDLLCTIHGSLYGSREAYKNWAEDEGSALKKYRITIERLP